MLDLKFVSMGDIERSVWQLFDRYFVYNPQFWDQIECRMDAGERALACALGLPVIQEQRLWRHAPAAPGVGFHPVTAALMDERRPRVFLLDRPDGSRYLVDTEGEDYCRFMARVY